MERSVRGAAHGRSAARGPAGALGLLAALALACAAGPRPGASSAEPPRMAACPASPNCVASEAADPARRVAAFELNAPPERAWPILREAVAGLAGTRIVSATRDSLRAECRSPLFRFVDVLELQLQGEDRVAIRSAARTGYYDFGVNRRRIERLRAELRARGVVR